MGARKGNHWGHLASQKYSAFLFAVVVLGATGFFLSMAAYGNLVMGVVGLYTAFVGGRAWSDGQALKFGQQPPEVSVVRPLPTKSTKKEESDAEVD